MRLRRTMLLVIFAGVLTLGIAGIASADWVGGGRWYHGTNNGYVYSNYHHNYNCHTSAARGRYLARSGPTAPGYWARASAPDRWWAWDKAYWNNRC